MLHHYFIIWQTWLHLARKGGRIIMKLEGKRNINGRLQLAGSFIFMSIIMVLCLCGFQYMLTRAVCAEVEDKMMEVIYQQSEQVRVRIHDAYADLDYASLLLSEGRQDMVSSLGRLSGGTIELPHFRYFGAVSAEGGLLYGDEMPAYGQADWQTVLAGNRQTRCFLAGELLPEEDALVLAVPLWQGDSPAGIVYGVLTGEELEKIFSGNIFDTEGVLFCFSADREKMLRFAGESEMEAITALAAGGQEKVLSDMDGQLKKQGYGAADMTAAGKDYYLAAAELTDIPGWYINSIVPADKVENVVNRLFWAAMAIFILLAVLFLAAFGIIERNKRRSQKKLLRLAYTDRLTGLPNWARLCRDKAEDKLVRQYVLAVFDIDEFSIMNSFLGREYCNGFLARVANLLRSAAGSQEMACRVTADRFVLYMKYDDECVQRLQSIKEDLQAEAGAYPVSWSCGAARPMAEDSLYDVYEMALTAIKAAKRSQQEGIVFYDQDMGAQTRHTKQLEADFAQALSRHELKLLLQPKHYLQKNGWAGSEALTRWQHPVFGWVNPTAFVPQLEESGEINKLDTYMLEESCRLIRSWLDENRQILPISVNLSRAHFAKKSLVSDIKDIVDKYKVPYQYLELEITESAVSSNYGDMLSKIKALRDCGFGIAIDDFGTGYSSLSLLDRIAATVIKLDKSFVDSWRENKESHLIADVVMMARHAGLAVVIEGLETEEQCSMARRAGCDIVQGYYYSRPLSIADYERLVYEGKNK